MENWSLKEIVSAMIALAIACVSLYLLVTLYLASSTANADAYQKASQVLQVAIALMGTVTGYYFGRIPAEAHAAGMQQIANTAQKASELAQTQLANTAQQSATSAVMATNAVSDKYRVVDAVQSLRDRLGTTPLGGGQPRPPELDFAISELDRIIKSAVGP